MIFESRPFLQMELQFTKMDYIRGTLEGQPRYISNSMKLAALNVKYFDGQEIVTNPPTTLSGIGLFEYSLDNMISPKVVTFNKKPRTGGTSQKQFEKHEDLIKKMMNLTRVLFASEEKPFYSWD